jgi:hypothetical protein
MVLAIRRWSLIMFRDAHPAALPSVLLSGDIRRREEEDVVLVGHVWAAQAGANTHERPAEAVVVGSIREVGVVSAPLCANTSRRFGATTARGCKCIEYTLRSTDASRRTPCMHVCEVAVAGVWLGMATLAIMSGTGSTIGPCFRSRRADRSRRGRFRRPVSRMRTGRCRVRSPAARH